jgi:hypothetical protein
MFTRSFSFCSTHGLVAVWHTSVFLEAPVLYFLYRLKNTLLLNINLLSIVVESKVCCASG